MVFGDHHRQFFLFHKQNLFHKFVSCAPHFKRSESAGLAWQGRVERGEWRWRCAQRPRCWRWHCAPSRWRPRRRRRARCRAMRGSASRSKCGTRSCDCCRIRSRWGARWRLVRRGGEGVWSTEARAESCELRVRPCGPAPSHPSLTPLVALRSHPSLTPRADAAKARCPRGGPAARGHQVVWRRAVSGIAGVRTLRALCRNADANIS